MAPFPAPASRERDPGSAGGRRPTGDDGLATITRLAEPMPRRRAWSALLAAVRRYLPAGATTGGQPPSPQSSPHLRDARRDLRDARRAHPSWSNRSPDDAA